MICEVCGHKCQDKEDHNKCDLCAILSSTIHFDKDEKELLRKADVNQFLEYIESMNYYDSDIENLLSEILSLLKRQNTGGL